MRLITIAVLGCALTLLDAAHGFAAKQIALVIGNSNYEHSNKLRTPSNNAEAVASALDRLGFSVLKDTDSDYASMRVLIQQFANALEGDGRGETADIALFYYSGHSIQLNGANYLIPVTANLQRSQDVEFQGIALDAVFAAMVRQNAKSIVLIDASFQNSFSEALRGVSVEVPRGLAPVPPAADTFIELAAGPGQVVREEEGKFSTFTGALLRHLETPGLDFESVMARVTAEVVRITGGAEVPSRTSPFVVKGMVLVPEPHASELVDVGFRHSKAAVATFQGNAGFKVYS